MGKGAILLCGVQKANHLSNKSNLTKNTGQTWKEMLFFFQQIYGSGPSRKKANLLLPRMRETMLGERRDELENSIKCTECSLWYHLVCVGITRDRERYLICERCLLLSVLPDENVSIIDNSEDSQ